MELKWYCYICQNLFDNNRQRLSVNTIKKAK